MAKENNREVAIHCKLTEELVGEIIEKLIDIEIINFQKKLKLESSLARECFSIESFSLICGSRFRFSPKIDTAMPIIGNLEIEYTTIINISSGSSSEHCRYSLISESGSEDVDQKKSEIFEILFRSIKGHPSPTDNSF